MTTFDTDTYLTVVDAEGAALAATAKGAPAATVPGCPKWTMVDLVRHTGEVHRWVTVQVADRLQEYRKRPEGPGTEDVDALLAWYRDGLSSLVDELRRAGPEEPVWNWFGGAGQPCAFWFRRMAHETAVHRWDADLAAGAPAALDPGLAADGLDELLPFVALRLTVRPGSWAGERIRFERTDGEETWLFTLDPAAPQVSPGAAGPADVTVAGTAPHLLLWALNRTGAEVLTTTGDRSLVERWGAEIRF